MDKTLQPLFEIGTLFKPSYSEKRYKVISIIRECSCPDPNCFINGVKENPREGHIHLFAREINENNQIIPGENSKAWFNGYDENSLKHLSRNNDQLIILK